MKLRASFQRLAIVALTATLVAAIGLISIQARKANQANAISAQPMPAQPVRAKAKKANAFEDAKEASRFNSSASSMAFEPMMFAPVVTATKSAVRVVTPGAGGDVNGNGFVNPGDTLMYSVVVSNTAAPGAGNDALNVVFTDQLNANLSLVGSATASPIATNDAYSVLGNVSISVPVGNGLLANDVNPQGTGTIAATAGVTSAQGGNVSVSANGSFTYNPPPGYEGSDTFTYTLTHSNGKMDTATVTLTISGMIWFVNNNAAACTTLAGGCGRLSNPFSSLAAFQALNNGTGNNPASGDNIFIFTGVGNYIGPLTLLSNQKLGGQGMTVSLTSFTGLTPPSFSATLPTTSGTRPNIFVQNNGLNAHNLTLSVGNTLRGFNLENQATGMGGNMTGSALFGTSFNNLTASEMSIVSSAGAAGNCTPAVNLNQGSGTAAINVTLNSVSADKCTNGILLADTTGSFTITGNGNTTVGGNSSGGTIQNTTSHGISLSNTQNISLTNLNIQNSADSGIFGSQVVNFTFDNGTINNSGTSLGAFDSNIAFSDGGVTTATSFVSGTVTITDSVLTLGYYDGVDIQNFTGTISNLTISNNTITSSTSTASSKAPGIRVLAFGSAGSAASVTTATINNNVVTNFPSDSGIMFQCGNATSEASPSSTCGSGANPINITNNTISGQNATNRIGTQGILFNVQGVGTGHFNVSGNDVRHTSGNSISHNVFGDAIATTTINGNTVVSNNTLGSQGIAGGTSFTTGFATNTPSLTVTITNNNVSQTDGNGILMVARDLATGSLNISVKNNTVAAPLAGVRPGIRVDAGNTTGDNDVCLDISGNTSAGSGGHQGIGLRKQGTDSAINAFGIEGMAATASPNVETYVAGLNPAGGGVLLISATSGFTNCGSAPIAAPAEGSSSANATNGSSNSSSASSGAAPSLFARVKQWLNPVFSAFASSISYVNLDKAFGKIEPTVSAAEHVVPPSGGISSITEALPPKGGTTSIPARTMIVNSRGETRIVPTAALAAMAGELITINGTGGGFTLPAGESTTIMFNATIGTGFTGTAITNQASVSGTGFGPILSNNLSTPVIQAPNFSKAFSPTTIATNTGVSTLTLTLVNPNPSQALSAVAFADAFPPGVEVAATPAATTSGCGSPTFAPAAAATSLSFMGGSIAAGGTCTVSVNVRGTTEGVNANISTTATSTQANPSSMASANLTVLNAPTFSKAFGASTVQLNGTTSLTFTITNNSQFFQLNGIGFTDTLPAGLVVATPNNLSTTCGGTATAAPGGSTVSLSGATRNATTSCTLTVNVTGTTVGAKNNSATLATTELGANSAATGTVTLTVLGPPTIAKAFSPTSITVGGSSAVTLTLTNPNATPLTGAAFSDTLTNMTALGGAVTGTCSGTTPSSLSAGATSLNFSGITIPASGSCTVIFSVTSSTPGSHPNATSGVTTTQTPTVGTPSNTANLSVFAPPTITKSFSPTGVAVGGTSTLTLTITNPAGNPAGVTGVAVSDTFPAGMEVNTTPGAVNTCGGTFTAAAMATSISLTGGSIGSAGGSCSVSVTVKATTGGSKLNTTGTVSSTQGGTGLTASATLSVAQAPTVAKSFSPTSIPLNGTSTLTLNFTNPNAFALSGLAISDAFPAGMEVAAIPAGANTCGGVFAPAAGNTSISLAGGSLTSSGSCSVSVAVKGTTAGAKNNITGNVSTTESGAGGTSNTATLTVIAPPSILKSFGSVVLISTATASGTTVTITTGSPHNFTNGQQVAIAGVRVPEYNGTFTITSVPTATTFTYTNPVSGLAASTSGATAPASSNVALNGLISMSIQISNTNSSSLSGIGFLDTLPAGITVPASFSTSFCGGTLNVTAPNSVSLSGASLGAGGGCIQAFSVRGAQAGSWQNTYTNVTSNESGPGPNSNTATLNVFAPPTIAKSFSPTGVQVGGTSTLTLTITNPAANPAGVTGIAVSDTFPAGMEVNTIPGATNTCGGTFAPSAGNTSISLTGGSIATAGGSCSISVVVKATTAGVKNNVTGTVSSTEGGTGLTAAATLAVAAAPTVAKSFSPSSIALNTGTSTLTISFTNPNAFALSGLAITDSFPAGVEVAATPAATNTCGGTFTPAAGNTAISLSGGSLTSSGSCSISVAVRGTTAGAKPNVTGNVSTTESGAGGTANATLNVFAPPTVAKTFVPTSVQLNGQSTLNIVITNPAGNPGGLSGIAISDTFPAGLEVSSPLVSSNSCGGTFAPTAGATSISLTGGAIATAGNNCTISVNVRGTTVGAKANTTGAVSSTEGGTGLTASATLNVFAPPTITKAFSPTTVAPNGTSTLTITITNPAGNPAGVTGVAVSDTFPAGMEVNTTPGATNTCGGTFSPAAMATSISLTGGSIASAGGSCSISVVVKGTTSGPKLNTTGTVSSTEGGTGLTASATLTVAAAPIVVKSFSPTSIPVGGTSTLTISFSNPNAFALNGLAISDSFPAGIEVNSTPGATNTCGGTFAPVAAATSISLSGGALTSSGSCSISVSVKATTGGAKLNITGNVSTTESGAGATANATLNVFAPPTITKAFSPTGVPLNGISTLTITITNPAANPAGVNGVAVSDTFPSGVVVDATPMATNTCGGTFSPVANAGSIALTGGTIASAGGSCSISVKVKGTTAGAKPNTTGAVSSTEGGTGLTASATLNVFAPPTITKAFSPTTIAPNGTSTLTITITNPVANPAGVTGVAVSDTFPAGMEVNTTPGATNTCGGTFSPAAMATSISLTGGSIASAGGSCSISVVVKGTTAGVKNNVTGAVSSTEGGTGLTASATLTVAAPPTVAKSFSPTSVIVGGTSTLTINFTNPNSAIALTGLAISDSFPAGVEVAATPGATNTCGGTFAPAAAATSISLTGGSLAASGSCSISVTVKGTTAGAKNNVTGNVSSTESGNGLTASATLNVFAPPTIAKAFSPTTVALNGTSVLTLTITNPAANPAGVNGVAVSDTFPAGLVVHTTPGATNTCGGSFAPSAGATNIALTGGAIATAGGSCSVSVTVRGTTAGAKPNTTGAVSSTEGGTGSTASATLNVFAPLTVAKSFSPTSILLNTTSTLTITLTNPASNPGGMTNIAISDPFPAGMEVDATPMATNTCGGTFAPAAAATTISLTNGSIVSAGGSCSISVKVKGTTQGVKTNTTGTVSSTEGGTGGTATATLDVFTCSSIVCPTDVFTATTGNSAVVNYPAPSANGICGTITCSPASGSSFNVGTTTVTCNSSIGNQSCSFNVTVNRTGGTVTDPLLCTGPGNTVRATLNISNNGNVNQTVSDTTTFTNLVGIPGTCTVTPNVGTCTVTNGNLTYNATLSPGQTVSITYLTQVSDLALTGAQVCTNNSVTFNGGQPFAFPVCDVVDCPAVGPGNPFPARSEASDQSAGSVLIYNVYTSSPSSPNTENTRVSLTNIHPQLSATVHLFFVDGNSCSVADSYVCLTANQTTSFLMSDLDPGTTGYIVAVATDLRGCPINFNYLIGDEYVKFSGGHAANLGAEAYSALPGGLPACNENSAIATINFDGVSYDRTARTVALDSIGSRAEGNDTMLILNRIGGNLGTGAASLGTIFGILYDDSENGVSFNITGGCQLRGSLTNNFPRTTPRFEQFIPAGRTAWMRLYSQSDLGLSGAMINFNAGSASSAGAFNQGHNLHKLTLSSAASYVLPVFPPGC